MLFQRTPRLLPKPAVANAVLVLASLTTTLIALEATTRAFDFFSPPPARSWSEFRLRLPPPYRHVPYDVAELIEEARSLAWRTGPDFGWLPEDRTGRYLNIRDHRRLTVGGSAGPPSWGFGGTALVAG